MKQRRKTEEERISEAGGKRVQFTPEQQKVIDLRDRNILVSAAAGSGKTAVLVERILKLILDEKNPVDIFSAFIFFGK